jgi:hypothetical protein
VSVGDIGKNSGDWGERGKNGVRAGENRVRGVRIPTAIRCFLPIYCSSSR